jgi:fructokinase
MTNEILCVGEVLWDALPDGLFLGGAAFNVACHLHALGEPVLFASRAGSDELGREIRRRMARFGLRTDLLQEDRELPTGFVAVSLDARGSPTFEILAPSAWDRIEEAPALLDAARGARALVFGSLAQRGPISRATIRRLLALARRRVFDVNLRPPFDDRKVVLECLPGTHLLKLNDGEWETLCGWTGIAGDLRKAAGDLAERFGIETICVTRGAEGAALWHGGGFVEGTGFRIDPLDAVGAGDAFLAALISGLLGGKDPAEALEEANALGAYVATRRGATPPHDRDAIARIKAAGRP